MKEKLKTEMNNLLSEKLFEIRQLEAIQWFFYQCRA